MLTIRVVSEPWYAGYKIGIFEIGDSGRRSIAKTVTFEEIQENVVIPESQSPLLHINQESAQLLMNDLWHLGVRPSDGTGSTGQLQATEKHLEDMRKLVFKLTENIS